MHSVMNRVISLGRAAKDARPARQSLRERAWPGSGRVWSGFACVLLLGAPRVVLACGASASSGGVAVCSLDDVRKERHKRWHLAASYSYAQTRIRFMGDELSGSTRFDQTRQLVLVSAAYRPKRWWSLELGAGALADGTLTFREGDGVVNREKRTMAPGPVAAIASSFVVSRGEKWVPFALVTVQFSAVFSSTGQAEPYVGTDLRVGAAVGFRVGSVFLPYVLARAFGGPISWKLDGARVQGTDSYHYQAGLGISMVLPRQIDLYIEGVPVGERGFSGGWGWTF